MTEKEFDDLIKEAGKIVVETLEKEDVKSLDKPCDIKFSKRHEKQMKKIFKMYRKQIKKQERMEKRKSATFKSLFVSKCIF